MKRLTALLLTALLLISPALAAGAGSQHDPLLSKSYVAQWEALLLADRAARISEGAAALKADAARETEMLRGRCGAQGARQITLSPGGSVLLREGDEMTLVSGEGQLRVREGTAADVTAGQILSSGALQAGHRVILCADARAVFIPERQSVLKLSGTAIVSPYRDSAPDQWFGSAVDYSAMRALMNGTGEGTFTPNGTLTRAMFVTILGRMAGVDAGKYPGTSFSDVEPGSWYAAYVQWGAKNGIVNGVGDGKFAPNDPVTREQMAALIIRYADSAGLTLPQGVNVRASFGDAASVSGWAFESVDRMRRTGLLAGDELGNFNPRKGATRAEAATVFMRLDATIRILK